MAGEAGKAVYRRFVEEVVNGGNFDIVDELYSPDYVDHAAPPGAPGGTAGVKAIMGMFRAAFPDVHFTIDLMVGEDDVVATGGNSTCCGFKCPFDNSWRVFHVFVTPLGLRADGAVGRGRIAFGRGRELTGH